MKVVIVDDDKNTRMCLKKMIDWGKYEMEIIGEAFDGEQAYNLILSENPDIIISDIVMPGLTGLELSEKVNANLNDVIFILISAHDDFSYAQAALKNNVKYFIVKPLNTKKIEELSEILNSIYLEEKKNVFCSNFLYDEKEQKVIFDRLKDKDIVFFNDFFEKCFNEYNFKIYIKDFYLKLIDIIYDYLRLIGLSKTNILQTKSDSLILFSKLKRKEEMFYFVKNLYYSLILRDDTTNYYMELVISIKKYIDDNYRDADTNIEKLASVFKFSYDYISKVFKNNTGDTINHYIVSVRLKKAADLIINTNLNVKKIGVMVGYSDSNYFYKAFKKEYGISPLEYKKR